jgi:hypothetical protein
VRTRETFATGRREPKADRSGQAFARRQPRGMRQPPTLACSVAIRGLPFGEALIRPPLTNANAAPARRPVGGSSNGRTPDSDSGCLGSNPSPPATRVACPHPPTTWPFRLESVSPNATALGHIVGHNSFLERHGQGWRFRVRLPRRLIRLTARYELPVKLGKIPHATALRSCASPAGQGAAAVRGGVEDADDRGGRGSDRGLPALRR